MASAPLCCTAGGSDQVHPGQSCTAFEPFSANQDSPSLSLRIIHSTQSARLQKSAAFSPDWVHDDRLRGRRDPNRLRQRLKKPSSTIPVGYFSVRPYLRSLNTSLGFTNRPHPKGRLRAPPLRGTPLLRSRPWGLARASGPRARAREDTMRPLKSDQAVEEEHQM